jgi:hypothetical protein
MGMHSYETTAAAASSSLSDADSSSSSLMCVLRVDMEDFYTDMLTCNIVTLTPDDKLDTDETEHCASRLVELTSTSGYAVKFKVSLDEKNIIVTHAHAVS